MKTLRDFQNKDGVVFDSAKKKVLFAEDLHDINDNFQEIQNGLADILGLAIGGVPLNDDELFKVSYDVLVGGGIDSYTSLCPHFDIDFTDSSLSPKILTPNGSVAIDNVNSKFGGGSASFTSLDSFVSIPVSNDFNFGSGDFTIDFWLYNPAGIGQEAIFAGYNDYWLAIGANWGTFGSHRIFLSSNGYSWDIIQGDSGAGISNYNGLLADQWNHFALVRSGDRLMTFVNGIIDIDTLISGAIVDPNITQPSLSIGRWGNNPLPMLIGNVDEFRVSKGIARWTSDFIPPVTPYSEGGTIITKEPAFVVYKNGDTFIHNKL